MDPGEIARINSERVSQSRERATPRQRSRLDEIPRAHHGKYLKSVCGDASPREAIKAKCKDCVGYEEMPKNMAFSLCETCPLVHYRPYKE